MNPRICVHCGAEFIGAITARYCSLTCQKKAERARNNREPFMRNATGNGPTCAYCGSGFTPKHPARRYCSDRCKMRAYRERQKRQKAVSNG